MTEINQKEKEALIWTLAEVLDRATQTPAERTDPIYILRSAGHKPKDFRKAAERIEKQVYAGKLEAPFSPVEMLILKICVEQSSWINQYRTGGPTAGNKALIDEALATLRSLAAKFEALGIEIVHIPFD